MLKNLKNEELMKIEGGSTDPGGSGGGKSDRGSYGGVTKHLVCQIVRSSGGGMPFKVYDCK